MLIRYSGNVGGTSGESPLKASRVKMASKGALIADGWQEMDVFAYYIGSRDNTDPNKLHFQNRHGNSANILYLDSHVGSVNTMQVHWTNPGQTTMRTVFCFSQLQMQLFNDSGDFPTMKKMIILGAVLASVHLSAAETPPALHFNPPPLNQNRKRDDNAGFQWKM
ncbi:MAG: hypothetical protein V8T87_16925 [Victivallales bacterium]